jgi:two-component system, OmpR family, sensor histidine kinase VicK
MEPPPTQFAARMDTARAEPTVAGTGSSEAVSLDLRLLASATPLDELDTIYRTAPIGLAVIDRQLRYVRINEYLARINGASVEAHIGRTVRDMVPDLAEQAELALKNLLETGQPQLDVEFVCDVPGRPGVQGAWLEQWHPLRNDRGEIIGISVVAEDVTERRRTEHALRENEARFRAFVTASSDLVYRMSPDWAQMREFDGRTFAADTGRPSHAWLGQFIAPEDQPQVSAAIRHAIDSRTIFQLEHRVRRADGSLGWISSRAVPLMDEDGEISEWFGAASDITARKHAEEAGRDLARRLERQFRLFDGVASTTPDFIYVFDRGGRFLYANRRLLEVWGRTLEGVIGKTCLELGYERWHHDMHMREIAQVIATSRPLKGEVPFMAPLTGIFGIYEYIFTPVVGPDGEVEVIAGTTRDVTERKHSEEALQASESRFRAIAEQVEVGLALTDRSGRFVYVNDRYCSIVSQPRDAILGRTVEDLTHPEDWIRNEPLLERTFTDGEPFVIEKRYVRPDGTALWVRNSVSARRDPAGIIVGSLAVSMDVTERVLAEEALREADRAKDEFLAMLSHELRNPLAPLRTSLKMFEREELSARGLQALQVSTRQLHQMTRLVDDLLEVSRVTRGKIDLRAERVILQHTIYGVAECVAQTLEERSQRLAFEIPGDPIWVHADPVRVAQILDNLLTNASKYSEPGARIEVAVRPDAHEVAIQVKDHGIGIEPQHLPKLFTLFSQVDTSIDRSHGGLGIGLALVKRLAELHGGRVTAHSDGPGTGSTFTVVLPRSPG